MVNRTNLQLTAARAFALAYMFGCGESVPIGQQPDKPPDAQDPALHGDDDGFCVHGDDFEPTVQWDGHVEGGLVPIAADRIRIQPPHGGKSGFVMFGSGPKLPAPTDPATAFPCGTDSADFWLPGYQYTIMNSDVTSRRMRFTIWQQEPFDPWCKLQTPDPMSQQPANCRYVQCWFCTCGVGTCKAPFSDNPVNSFDGSYARFDITVEGENADGSVQGLVPDTSASIGGPVERVRLYAADQK